MSAGEECRVCGETYPNLFDVTPDGFIECCPGAGVDRIRRVVEPLTEYCFPSGQWRTQAVYYACDGCGEHVYPPNSQFAHVQRERMAKQ